MNVWKIRFCYFVIKLDRIPRFGRLYEYTPPVLDALRREDIPNRKDYITHWRWQRWGNWGTFILDRLGLYWKYLDLNEEMPEDLRPHMHRIIYGKYLSRIVPNPYKGP